MRYTSNSFQNIFHHLLKELKEVDEVEVRGLKTKELIDVNIELTDVFNVDLPNRDKNYYKYLFNEFFAYLSGSRDAAVFEKISKFWGVVKNKDNSINSNYGYLLFHKRLVETSGLSQFEWCLDQLVNDKYSRKTVVNFNDITQKFKGNKDMICTMHLQYIIRDNKLELYSYMRSNDLIKGLSYDLPFFCFTQILMWIFLKAQYPKLEIGSYHHHSLSLHIYERDYEYINLYTNNRKIYK